jgi:hypothetical protein
MKRPRFIAVRFLRECSLSGVQRAYQIGETVELADWLAELTIAGGLAERANAPSSEVSAVSREER